MSKKEVNRKKNNGIKIFSTIIIFIVVIAIFVYSFAKIDSNTNQTFIIKNGKISDEETDIGYIIRDETVIKGENYKNGMIQIIDEGKKVAETIYERHRFLSAWLTDLGVDSETAASDACRIEHVISAESFTALKKYLKSKGYDPEKNSDKNSDKKRKK